MTREVLSLPVADLSAFVKSLRREMEALPGFSAQAPGHLALMNMAARAAGFRNLQHLRANLSARKRLEAEPAPTHAADAMRIEALLRHFDEQGRLVRWPSRTALQHLAVRVLWARVPPRVTMDERAFSALLNRWHLFGDAPILRRTMVELGLITRSADCRDYCRIEAPPAPEARAAIGLLARRGARPDTADGNARGERI